MKIPNLTIEQFKEIKIPNYGALKRQLENRIASLDNGGKSPTPSSVTQERKSPTLESPRQERKSPVPQGESKLSPDLQKLVNSGITGP